MFGKWEKVVCPECGAKSEAYKYANELRQGNAICWECLCKTGKRILVTRETTPKRRLVG